MSRPSTPKAPLTELPLSRLLDTRHAGANLGKQTVRKLSQFPGVRISDNRGQGLEFEDLREYAFGDDTRYIDWNVTARTNRLHTRLYREERERTTTVHVDMRACMFTGTKSLKVIDASLAAASTLWKASEMGDRCSAVVFSNESLKVSRPVAGTAGTLKACQLISTEFARVAESIKNHTQKTHGSHNDFPHQKETDLLKLFDWINSSDRRTGVHVVFSGVDAIDHANAKSVLSATGKRAGTFVVMMLDIAEVTGLPAGQYHSKFLGRRFYNAIPESARDKLTRLLTQSVEQTQSLFSQYDIPCLAYHAGKSPGTLEGALRQARFL